MSRLLFGVLRRGVAAVALSVVALLSPAALAAPAGHGDVVPDEHEPARGHTAEHHEAPGHINWFYGVLGSKEGVEPSLFWRTPDMPPPLGALVLNTAAVFFLLGYFGRRPVAEALKRRKAEILRGMNEAAGMKEEAYAQLASYETKLEHIQEEIDRVRREMREVGEAERDRILRDAQDKRERLEREARTIVALELKAAREELKAEAIRGAVTLAREVMERQLGPLDQERLLDEYLVALDQAALGGPGDPSRIVGEPSRFAPAGQEGGGLR